MLIDFNPDFWFTYPDGRQLLAHLEETPFELTGTQYVRYRLRVDGVPGHFEHITVAEDDRSAVQSQLAFDQFINFAYEKVKSHV